MGRAVPIQPSFARGEISPRLWSRVDLSFYRLGLELCENFIVLPHGGATRLPGTRFVGEVADSAEPGRLLPFEFSTEQAYVLEACDGAFRFFRDQGQIWVDATDAALVNGAFQTDLSGWSVSGVSWSAGAAAFSAGDTLTQSVTVADPTKELVLAFDVAGDDGGALDLRVGVSAGGTDILEDTTCHTGHHVRQFTPGAGNGTFHLRFRHKAGGAPKLDNVRFLSGQPLTLTAPYATSQLFDIQHTQSADVMYFAHRDVQPGRLSRIGHASWSMERVRFTGRPAEWDAGNWPQRVGFYEDRLAWAATPNEPQTIWLSAQDDLEKLTRPSSPTDADALKFTISAGQVNAIQWLVEDQQLQIGTSGATRTLSGAGVDEPLTPNSVKGKRHSTFGAAPIQPVQVGEVTIYVGRFRRRLREFVYSFERDRYVSPDLTLLSEHVTAGGITALTYAQDPDSIVWMPRADGQLIGLTYERDQEVAALHRHKIAGGAADAHGQVESCTVIPGAARNELWLIVRRTIDGATRRYVEFLEAVPETGDAPFFVHAGLTYDGREQAVALTLSAVAGNDIAMIASSALWSAGNVGDRVTVSGGGRAVITGVTSPTEAAAAVERNFAATDVAAGWTLEANSVSGLGHLEGEKVAILADGAVVPAQAVTGGRIALPGGVSAAVIHAGLGYASVLKTLRPEAGAPDGTAQGRLKRIHQLIIRVRNTLGLKYGKDRATLDTVVFRKAGQPMDSAPPLYTGDLVVALDQGWGPDAQVVCVQDQPLPAEIQAIVPKLETTAA